jgi:hypothetical protein
VEHGAELVICINPLVPFDNQARDIPKLGPNAQRVSDKGFGVITNQVSRVMLHAGLQYHIKHLRRAHPDVDIIVIEPRRDDARLFFNNIMRYSSRLHVLHHGYESVLVELEEREPAEKEMLARHGIRLRRSLMREQLRRIRRAAYDPDVVSQVVGSRRRRPLEVGARAARWDALSATLELLDRELSLRETRKTA